MKETKINCDFCNQDLTTTGPRPDYRLSLRAEPLPHEGGVVFSLFVSPPIDREHHFCGKGCLRKWINGEVHDQLPR